VQSGPPESITFNARLLSRNGLVGQGFKEWVFLRGMLFGAERTWWGTLAARTAPHEGLDICLFRDGFSTMHQVEPGLKVPAAFGGTIIHICSDFLCESLFVRHDDIAGQDRHLFTIYGHIEPVRARNEWEKVSGGETIATIADAGPRRATVPSHLHISTAWISDAITPAALNWQTLSHQPGITLINPLSIMAFPYGISDAPTIAALQSEPPNPSS
jgi:hypothetical protein